MSYSCLLPRIAVQEKEGQKPRFLKLPEYEFYLKAYSKTHRVLLIPCGKCVNCLKKKSQEWTARLLKESLKHKYNYFITLTYDDLNVNELNKRDIQLFLKRYRKQFGVNLKYYVCGEHGETTNRPHYHAVFFQDKPIDDVIFYANNLYISKSFQNVWKKGHCLISKQVNERSIKYTIAYTLKKLGEEKVVLMSKGIGLEYFKVNHDSIRDHDGFYIVNGFKQSLPTYFKRKLKESTDIYDIAYLFEKENDVSSSRRLSGHYINDLIRRSKEESNKKILKGKEAF